MGLTEEFGLDVKHGFSITRGKYRCWDDWLWIFFPMFNSVKIERVFPWPEDERENPELPINRHAYHVASEVIQMRCWWPEGRFRNFMERLHSSGQPVESAFYGRRPPFTHWKLDELIAQGATPEDVANYKEEYYRDVRIVFDAGTFCGADAMWDARRGGFYDELWKDLEPPPEVKRQRAELRLRDIVTTLGKDRVVELAQAM